MSLTYLDRHNSQVVRLGMPGNFDSGEMYHYSRRDPIGRLLHDCIVQTELLPVETTVGFHLLHDAPSLVKLGGSKPAKLEYSSSDDFHRYGSFLYNLGVLGRILSDARPFVFNATGQHPTNHAQYMGVLQDDLVDDTFAYASTERLPEVSNNGYGSHDYYYGYINDLGIDIPVWRPSLTIPGALGLYYEYVGADAVPFGYEFFRTGEVYHFQYARGRRELRRTLQCAADQFVNGAWTITQPAQFNTYDKVVTWFVTITDFEYFVDDRNDWASYHMEWGMSDLSHGGSIHIEFDVRHDWSITPLIPDPLVYAHALSNEYLHLLYDITHMCSYACVQSSGSSSTMGIDWWWPQTYTVGSVYNGSADYGYFGYSSAIQRADPSVSGLSVQRFLSRNLLGNWTTQIDRSMSDIRASAYLSSSDALDQVTSTIPGNLVETIGEGREFITLLPSIIESIQAIREFKRGNIGSSVKDLLDIVSNLHLLGEFAIAPDVRLLNDTLPSMVTYLQKIQTAHRGKVLKGYGRFEYDFPLGTFGREINHLTTRTLIQYLDEDTSSSLEKILGLRAMSLLPSPSALWDLVPWSFVVDWFLDVGSRIRDAESISLLSLMNIQCYTHTYLITSPLVDDDIGAEGLRFSEDPSHESAELRLFVRDISQYPPPPRDSQFDYRLPSRLPNWLTSGSLAWQNLPRIFR